MQNEESFGGWKSYAITGRPDFLNYLRRGDVTWAELWRFYRDHPAESEAMVRLSGLFHIFQSQDYERQGSVLDRDGAVYQAIREWARFAVALEYRLPESRLRDSLATLLGQSLICPLYYEAVFSVYLEASLERHADHWRSHPDRLLAVSADERPPVSDRHLTIHLPELPRCPMPDSADRWELSLTAVVGRHYAGWNQAYALALGEENGEGWIDEGGEA